MPHSLTRLDQPDFEIKLLSNWLKWFPERVLSFKKVFAALPHGAYDQFQSQFSWKLCCTVKRGWEWFIVIDALCQCVAPAQSDQLTPSPSLEEVMNSADSVQQHAGEHGCTWCQEGFILRTYTRLMETVTGCKEEKKQLSPWGGSEPSVSLSTNPNLKTSKSWAEHFSLCPKPSVCFLQPTSALLVSLVLPERDVFPLCFCLCWRRPGFISASMLTLELICFISRAGAAQRQFSGRNGSRGTSLWRSTQPLFVLFIVSAPHRFYNEGTLSAPACFPWCLLCLLICL